MTRVVCLCGVALILVGSAASSASGVSLRYVDHTGIEIAIAWDPVPQATGYLVQRDTAASFDTANLVAYPIEASVTGFGDTGWPLDDWRRFRGRSNPTDSPTYHLDPGTDYYYQVIAQTPAGSQTSNSVGPCRIADYHSASEVVRGVPGDLWADVVLGKPSFAENTFLKTDPYHLQQAGGVVLDTTTRPTHVFLLDANHNRILGLEGLGRCRISPALCTIDADCNPGDTCGLQPGEIAPTVVLGQSSATDHGACNFDGTMQVFPNVEPPTASSLCFMQHDALSVGESDISTQAALDSNHNLYVPDTQNNRVLMYRDPFNPANGAAAAAVWGQDSFTAALCNKGSPSPTMSSLCGPTSVDIDGAGNLWVCDGAEVNSRVLRFPRDPLSGVIATTADIALTGFWHPVSVRVDQGGNVYVDDWYGVSRFVTPQPGTGNTGSNLIYISNDPDRNYSTQMAFDPMHPTHLWVELSHITSALYDLTQQTVLTKVHSPLMHGMDVSQTGDLFTLDSWYGLYRLAPGQQPGLWTPGDLAFLSGGAVTLDSLSEISAITTAGNQLLVADRQGVFFWNDYHTVTQSQAITQPADGMWIQPGGPFFVKTDTRGRIWIGGWFGPLQIFSAPLTGNATPIKTVSVSHYKDAAGAIVPWPGGQPISTWQFVPIGSGDQAWVTETETSPRLLRITNVDGLEDPTQPAYVDLVLGQSDLTSVLPNKGRGPLGFGRDTLGGSEMPVLDFEGNLYVQDNATFGVDGGDTRILRWNAGTIPANPGGTIFNLLPDSVYGFGAADNFTAAGSQNNPIYPYPATEVASAPRAPAFDGSGRMVLGGCNPYEAPRFPLVYLNKDQNYEPQLALGDSVSFPSVSYMDPDGNLYLGDYDWYRVLVYKAPFAQFAPAPVTPSPTPSCTITTPGQTAWQIASIRAMHINDGKPGNDWLQIVGQFTMATGLFSIDPMANGIQLELRTGAGAVRLSTALPGGAYQYPGPGWTKNRSGTKYTFTNRNPVTTAGINSMTITSRGGGTVRVSLQATKGDFGLLPSDGPLTLTVVLGGASSGAAGECGETTMSRCGNYGGRTNLFCRY